MFIKCRALVNNAPVVYIRTLYSPLFFTVSCPGRRNWRTAEETNYEKIKGKKNCIRRFNIAVPLFSWYVSFCNIFFRNKYSPHFFVLSTVWLSVQSTGQSLIEESQYPEVTSTWCLPGDSSVYKIAVRAFAIVWKQNQRRCPTLPWRAQGGQGKRGGRIEERRGWEGRGGEGRGDETMKCTKTVARGSPASFNIIRLIYNNFSPNRHFYYPPPA